MSGTRRLYTASVLLGSFLLFLVEPMVAKLELPRFGGGPAVWSTCLLFFQGLLLAAYAYAHFSVTRLGVRRQIVLHAVVLAIPFLALPPALRGPMPAPGVWPVPALLLALGLAVGPA